MREITSPNAFKTCYIAEVKEELGLKAKNRIAANRKRKQRQVKTPKHLKPFLIKAITILKEETQNMPTYKEIQRKAFELYKKEQKIGLTEKYFGFLNTSIRDKKLIKEVVESEEIFYKGA